MMKLMRSYMQWVNLKTDLVSSKQGFTLPWSAVPGKVSVHDFFWLNEDKQALFRRYYRDDGSGFALAVRRQDIPSAKGLTAWQASGCFRWTSWTPTNSLTCRPVPRRCTSTLA